MITSDYLDFDLRMAFVVDQIYQNNNFLFDLSAIVLKEKWYNTIKRHSLGGKNILLLNM